MSHRYEPESLERRYTRDVNGLHSGDAIHEGSSQYDYSYDDCRECLLVNRCKWTDGTEQLGHCREGRDSAPREYGKVSKQENVA